jgi:hypothetical protein
MLAARKDKQRNMISEANLYSALSPCRRVRS